MLSLKNKQFKKTLSSAPIPSVTEMKHEEWVLVKFPTQYTLEWRPCKKTPSNILKTLIKKVEQKLSCSLNISIVTNSNCAILNVF